MKISFCKKCVILIPLLIAMALEALPLGAVVREFNPSTSTVHTVLYSYFNTIPFGLGNFCPFITAIFSCLLLLSAFVHVFIRSVKSLTVVSCIVTLFFSLGPIMLTTNCFNIWSLLVSAMLIIEMLVLVNTNIHNTTANLLM